MKRNSLHRPAATRLAGLTLLCLAGLVLAASPYPDTFTDLRRLEPVNGDAHAGAPKATTCFACHGADGAPTAPTFPRLAGQHVEYLYHRLVSFRHSAPGDPYYSKSPMTPLAAQLTDRDMRDLAAYFSQQTPMAAAGVATAPDATAGEALFLNGNPSRGTPPCQGCHGPDARGPLVRTHQYAAWPSLRGQSSVYLVSRLTSYRDGHPSDTSNTFIMAGVAHTLDDASIQALAAYLSSLTPTPP
jgi:cytochrome c553